MPSQAAEKLQIKLAKALGLLGNLLRLGTHLEATPEQNQSESELIEEEIKTTLNDSQLYLEESKLELLTRQSNLNDWTLIIYHLEEAFEEARTLRGLSKNMLLLIMDDGLESSLSHVVDQSDLLLHELSKQIETGKSPKNSDTPVKLSEAVSKLKEEMIRFRATRTTRKFELEDVETYFVFFHYVDSITKHLLKVSQILLQVI